MGPQQSLYLPAPWLQKDANEVVVFDYTDLDFTAIPTFAAAVIGKFAKTNPKCRGKASITTKALINGHARSVGKNQDDQINYFDHLDHLDKTKDLAAKMIKRNELIEHLEQTSDGRLRPLS